MVVNQSIRFMARTAKLGEEIRKMYFTRKGETLCQVFRNQ